MPSIPAKWKSFKFLIVYRDSVLNVHVTPQTVALKIMSGPSCEVDLFNQKVRVTKNGLTRPMPAERCG